MRDALISIGLKGPWPKGLDVGGAEGAVARLMRGSGLVNWVACNDYIDLADKLPTSLFWKYYARYRIARATGGKLPKFRLPTLANNLGPTAATSASFWTHRLRTMPKLDAYIADDFYKLPTGQRFDLISSLLVINYFDAEEKLVRVAQLLNEGGTFVLLASSFWWPVNAAFIVGKFPYTSQRLNRRDLERYLREHHPEEADDAMKRYDYFHKTGHKPTLDDYIELADKHRLSLLKADYLIPIEERHKKTPLTPFALENTTDLPLSKVLADVQTHRPDVRLVDLKAAYVLAVFRKRGGSDRTASALLKK